MTTTPSRDSSKQSDLLLWVAGGVIATVGVAWLVILRPWAGSPEPEVVQQPTLAVATAAPSSASAEGSPTDELSAGEPAAVTLDNPLRMAQLAYEAGMLVEPAEYSAWTLYNQVIKADPGNAQALEGLTKVADDLVRRGETALEQGRFDDARAAVERIREALPGHSGAKALADKISPVVGGGAARASAPGTFKPEIPVQLPPKVAPVEVAVQAPAKPAVDPVVEASEAFERAMASSRLLTPVDQSAKHYVEVLTAANPNHELTRAARQRLSKEFLSRATQSLEALDAEAAEIWIDEAEAIGSDAAGVLAARTGLTEHLIAMESAKPLPASALKIATYVAPEYPVRALERRIQGWVDVEFTVRTNGATADIRVSDASHDNYFRREAVAAVEKWQFEPRIFMNRPIEQRSYTRIRFVQ